MLAFKFLKKPHQKIYNKKKEIKFKKKTLNLI